MSYFTTAANLDALALLIIPDQPGATADQRAALTQARQDLKDNFLTEMGKFINAGLNDIFTTGTPIPNDGGSALQIAWKLETQS